MDYLTVTLDKDVLRVAGDLDLGSAPVLADAIAEFTGDIGRPVRVDMAAVNFVDSSGLRCLLQAKLNGANVIVVAASPAVRRLFDLSGVTELFGLS